MDKKIANNVTLGLFVMAGLFVFIFFLFKVGGGGSIFSSTYDLTGRYKDVKGLHAGSEVSLSGLRVGEVEKIVISDETKDLVVHLKIEKAYQEKIRADSQATIVTQGVLGDKYIQISIGSQDAMALNDGDEISTSEGSDLFSEGKGVMEGLKDQFRTGGGIDKLVSNLNALAKNLVVITTDIRNQKMAKKLGNSLQDLEDIMGKIDQGKGSLGALINDPTLYEDMKYLMGGAKRSTILKYFMQQFIDEGKSGKRRKAPAKKKK